MDCRACSGTFIAWDHRILSQLTDGVRARFPVVLTRKYACDQAVFAFLRSRTLGNSSTALRNILQEGHSDAWLRNQLQYLEDCQRHSKGLKALHLTVPQYQQAVPFPQFPGAAWFLSTYIRDVWCRLPELLAAATSTFCQILKIDSTKKVWK